ncbi:IS110 family transposase [Clostridium sp. WCA-389-WT-23D1]|uniref:IS110 family transposase n=1 Tax=Clostridium porci TaxID=2605778 RepID=A0A7X2NPA3_9CLOT|nr:transposase [Clostridium porci]MSS38551.1 IS110 family transposase [Clostridium porci]
MHKETHTAVMLDCWNHKLGEITFENKPAQFHKLTRKVSRFVTEEKTAVYGLENAYGYGRTLAVWLFERGKTEEKLAGELRPVSHNNCSVKRAEKILELVKSDGGTCRDCQESRDIITRSLANDLEHYRKQMEEVEAAIEAMLPEFGCTLMTMPGIDIITAANILAEIGNIDRFPNAKKLAKFAGIAPINFSSAGKGKDVCPKQGNRRLQAIFYFLAIQMVQVAPSGTPRNALFREYFLKKLEEGKNKPQALICIARRLVNIVYGMLKNHTEYREPERKTGEETV